MSEVPEDPVTDVVVESTTTDVVATPEVVPEDCCGAREQLSCEDTEPPPQAVVEAVDDGTKKVRIAVAGCAHGEMDKIYDVLAEIEKEKGYKFDLLICCGDYQAVRNFGDLHHMHVNEKYRSIQTFYKYYSGAKTAPVLTVFVGGNHEASGYLNELPNGGWVAPNIFYMGFANVVRFAGLRIAGLSGIFNQREFLRGHYERPPFSQRDEVVSAYHVRNIDVWRLKQLRAADDDKTSNPIDIMISHDWPSGIHDYGDVDRLLRIKPYFRQDVEQGKLGNPATMALLFDIRPRYWLAAHLHVAFPALVPHKPDGDRRPEPTRFLALDKPLPRRQFIQALELRVDVDADFSLSYDPTWLAVLKNTDEFTTTTRENVYLPSATSEGRSDFRPTAEETAWAEQLGDMHIDTNGFCMTAPPLTEINDTSKKASSSPYYKNPQSSRFCGWLAIKDLNEMLCQMDPDSNGLAHFLVADGKSGLPQTSNDDFGDADFIEDRGALCAADSDGESEAQNVVEPAAEDSDEPISKRQRVDEADEVQPVNE